MMPTQGYYTSGYNNTFIVIINNRYHLLTAHSVPGTVLRVDMI